MQNILDNKEGIKKLDSKNMLASIQLLENQAKSAWEKGMQTQIPSSYIKVKNIIATGMGGSTLGIHLLRSVFEKKLDKPMVIVNGYEVPAYAGPETLVIVSSYSGNTEETLSAAKDALSKKAKVLAICAGGKLAVWAKKNNIPAFVFTAGDNPCGSPRMGLGYSIFGQAALLVKMGLINISENEFCALLGVISSLDKKFGADNPESGNTAKQYARKLLEKSVWFAASEHLTGNAHIAANQMNENAKRFAGYFGIPELNHHLMEGMIYPKTNKDNIAFMLIRSELYDKKIQKRYGITAEVLTKNKIQSLSYECQEKTRIGQACEVLVFSSYLSYYSAILEGLDPTAIPFVDFFKERLKK